MSALRGKRALVTGAARGIGRACAVALAEAGAKVTCVDIAPPEPLNGAVFTTEISDPQAVTTLFDKAGPQDIVINAAGILIEAPTLEADLDTFDLQIAVNLRGSFLVARAALIGMAAQKHGRLILIASELAHLGRAGFAGYCASKAGVIGLTRALAREFAPDVLVNAIAPGPTDTAMLSAQTMSPEALALETQNPLGRIARPEEIAAAAVFLSGPGGSFMTGQTICPSGGAVML
ncbi:SDR family oxidoreductase [uncultured Roseobacter sp.]|uniref:SDR family NAD(P)-dependent oxidoreductase n=1 Tax=uncultured Roseobacter sp. TaxID=114847 RepID=UPI00262FD936|nr:SDR family oxidoreductase [uncultured Roseobacter sp.]